MDNLIFVAAAIAVIAVIIILVLITGYVKAPTDTAVIISGLKKEPKYVIGRSSIKIPFLQRTDKLTLKMISVDVKTEESVPTNDYINVNIDSAVKVKVSMDPEKMKLAASNFLNKNEDYIRNSVVDVLQGNVREIIGQMKLEEIVQDRKKFADKVQENAAPDMAKMGLDIVSFNVQNVTDKAEVIENLGIDRIVSISKSAQISKAESLRDIAVAKASADKQANDARVEAETAIAEQNNALEIKSRSSRNSLISKRLRLMLLMRFRNRSSERPSRLQQRMQISPSRRKKLKSRKKRLQSVKSRLMLRLRNRRMLRNTLVCRKLMLRSMSRKESRSREVYKASGCRGNKSTV